MNEGVENQLRAGGETGRSDDSGGFKGRRILPLDQMVLALRQLVEVEQNQARP